MMKAIVIGIFMMIGLSVSSQTNAQGYFNSGAKDFVHSKLEKAIATVDEGLKKYPNDEKLNELKKKLVEEKKKEDQKKDQQNKDDQNKKDQENKDKNKKEEDKKEDENKKNENKDKDDQKNQDQNKEKEKQPQQQQPQAGQMTPEQIKQLLETMNNEEAKTQKKVNAQKVKGTKRQQEKDW